MMAPRNRRFVIDEEGNMTAVILPIKEYEDLLKDLQDLATIAERRSEPTELIEFVARGIEEESEAK